MPQVKIDRDKFKKLSSALTGVQPEQLSPNVDPIGILEQYCVILEERLSQQHLSDINEMSDKLATSQVKDLISDVKFAPLARCIMKLWLLGGWYDPRTPSKLGKVVSSQAYKESLVWRAMQSHPMGYSMLPFEHWTREPQPLEKFLTFVK